jgi:hypothetical protein
MKAMIFFLVMVTITVASADVNINKELYTTGAGAQDDISLQGTNYQNDIYISDGSIYETGVFGPYSDMNSINNRININSGGLFGTTLNSKGQELKGSRQLFAGSSPFLAVNYGLSNGESESSSYSGLSYGREKFELENAHYENAITGTPTSFSQNGVGLGLLNGDYQSDSVNHYIELAHDGKYSNINLQINSIKDEGVRPASYSWGAGISADKNGLGLSGITVGTSAGDAQMDVEFQGKSSDLPSQELSKHIYPLTLDETIKEQGPGWFDDPDFNQMIDLLRRSAVSQNIYMTYTIDDSDKNA